MKPRACLFASFLGLSALASADSRETTILGWFADELCATQRVKAGRIGPTNRECAQRSISQGAKMVFIDEKAAKIYVVANPEAAKGQESHYVRVTGSLDADMLVVESVEVLKEYVASCRRPPRK